MHVTAVNVRISHFIFEFILVTIMLVENFSCCQAITIAPTLDALVGFS